MSTTQAAEQEEQGRWRPLPRYAEADWFNQLIANEFFPPARQQARLDAALARIVHFAVSAVPFYADLFAARSLTPGDVATTADLVRLPLITKRDVQQAGRRLQPARLPHNERVYGVFSSSGTTGPPTRVVMTQRSNFMFGLLWQRQARWFRFDPQQRLAMVRLASLLPRRPDGSTIPDGETLHLPRWRYVGRFFETGPAVGFNLSASIDDQIAWLRREQPAYFVGYPGTLEEYVLACGGKSPSESICGLLSIGAQLFGSMRRRIEAAFAAPVEQNYGLNEIGLVAIRCPAGRYHVNTEHCLVEVVDEEGQAAPPGKQGQVLVTGLTNLAMPLIRYETGDLAEAVEGPCPCGRTLPSFGELAGRIRRFAGLPQGTRKLVDAICDVFETIPPDVIENLRQYRLHQYRDASCELRLQTAGPLPPQFAEQIRAAWEAAGGRDVPLSLAEVDKIERGPGGKYLDFTSDFHEETGEAATEAGE